MHKRLAGVLVALVILTGCAGNVPTPETPAERLASIEVGAQAAANTLRDLANQRIIVGDDARLALEALDGFEQAVRVARLALATGAESAPALAAANAALQVLLQLVQQHQPPGG